ncbi:MAG: DUF2156 domain-containing protein [Christensenellales bacterium]
MDLKKITLQDRPVIQSFLQAWQMDNSEYCFTNMFIWQNIWQVKYAVEEDVLYLWAQHRNQPPIFYVPLTKKVTGDICEPIKKIAGCAEKHGWILKFRGITERMKAIMENSCKNKFCFSSNPNVDDYIYRTSDLMELSGKKYHAKRNHIKKFLEMYQYEYEPLTRQIVPECLAFYDEWAAKRENTSSLQDERVSLILALENYEALGLTGCAIRIQGKVQAFSVGEMINDTDAIIHIEKANDEINGLYAFINRQFLIQEWSHTKYVNREEDMGVPGLRKAKESYHPVRMVKKYEAVLIDKSCAAALANKSGMGDRHE